MKIKVVGIFIFIMLLSVAAPAAFQSIAYASNWGEWDGSSSSNAWDYVLSGFDPSEFKDDDGKKLTWFERSVAGSLFTVMAAVIKVLKLDPLETLVFAKPMKIWGKPLFGGDNIPEVGGIFHNSEWENIVKPGHAFFKSLSFAILMISVILGGMNIALKSGNPVERAMLKEMVLNWLITALMLGLMLQLVLIAFDINTHLVAATEELARNIFTNYGIPLGDDPPTVQLMLALATGSWFFTFLCYMGLIIMTIYFNVLYLLRKLIILALLIIGPLVVLAWGKGKQMSFYLWISELVSNIFMQAAHAIVFVLYLSISVNVTDGFMGSPFGRLLMLSMLIPVGMLLRQLITGWFGLLGIDEEMTAGKVLSGAFGSISSIGRMASGAVKGGVGAVVGGIAGGAVGGPAGAVIGVAGGLASGAPDVMGGVMGAGGGIGETMGAPRIGGSLGQTGAAAGSMFDSVAGGVSSVYSRGMIGGEDSGLGGVGTVVSYDGGRQMQIEQQNGSQINVPTSNYLGDPSLLTAGQDVRVETETSDLGHEYVTGVVPIGYGVYKDDGSIDYGRVEMSDGRDVYVSRGGCPNGVLPHDGQRVSFDFDFGGFLPQATNVRYE